MTVFKTTDNVLRILILRGGALGDFILTLPAIRALRRRWPSVVIELVGHSGLAELGVITGLINRVRSLDAAGMAQWFIPHCDWSERERVELAAFDIILSYLGDPDGIVQANLLAAGAQQVMVCSPVVASGHAADHFLRPVADLGISTPVDADPLLPWPAALREQGRHWLQELGLADDTVALHPGSGSARKNWPVEKFVRLADLVRRSMGARPLFILGEADAAAAKALARLAPTVPVLANRPLKAVASALAACRGYVGNDSGITHLAAALGLPVVALFGPTVAAMWGPRGAKVSILQGPEQTGEALSAITPESVLAALARVVS